MKKMHGGKRLNSGRKKLYNETTTKITCPKSLVKEVKKMIFDNIKHSNLKEQKNYLGVPSKNSSLMYRPLAQSSVSAGFPSPADDYIDLELDLNDFFVKHPSSTFYWKVRGDSMNLAGILDGCYLLIDRSLEASNNDIVLAVINGDVTVKRFINNNRFLELRPESTGNEYKTIKFKRTEDIEIWGVVSAAFNKYK